jgi:toxin ParE1/3/4
MSKVKFSREARSDLRAIDNYTYQTWGRAQADKYIEIIEKGCRLLAKHPALGRPQDEFSPGLRKHPIGKHYIFYRALGKGIEVIRVLHQAMAISRHLAKK